MIAVRNLIKKFGGQAVLDGITLEVKQGEIIVVIGPSGTGKSTLLRCINFLEQPDDGEIQIGEHKVAATRASRHDILALRRNSAFVFQNYALFANKTADMLTEAISKLKPNSKPIIHSDQGCWLTVYFRAAA